MTTLDTNNFAELARLSGMATGANESRTPTLIRLGIQHKALTAKQEVKGKQVNVEVVEAGSFRLKEPVADGKTLYATDVTLRPFMQRVYYRRWVNGTGDSSGNMMKTLMANDLKSELKDTEGGFNCGKPSTFFDDWDKVPSGVKEIIRATKRTRAIFGTVTVNGAMDAEGNAVETPDPIPVIWEVDNKEAFTAVNVPFNKLFRMQALPMHYNIKLSSEARELNNGESYFVPKLSLDLKTKLDMLDSDQETFTNFLDFIKMHNTYVLGKWEENNVEDVDDSTKELVNEFINVDTEEAA